MEDLSLADDIADGMEEDLATTSIMHNFIFRGDDVAERFFKILEESANDPPMPCPYEFKYLQDPDEIRECLNKFKQARAQRKAQANAAKADSEEE